MYVQAEELKRKRLEAKLQEAEQRFGARRPITSQLSVKALTPRVSSPRRCPHPVTAFTPGCPTRTVSCWRPLSGRPPPPTNAR